MPKPKGIRNPCGFIIACFSALLIFAGCQQGGLLQDNVFGTGEKTANPISTVTSGAPLLTATSALPAAALVESIPADLVYGAIISSDPATAEKLIVSIPHKEKYGLIAILAPTAYAPPEANIFTYEFAGALAEKGIMIDTEVIQNLICCKLVKTLGEIKKESSWNGGLLPMLKKQFPEAKFVLLSVNESLSASQARDAATLLKTSLPPYSLLLAQADFAPAINPNLQTFQEEFISDTLLTLNAGSFGRLPLQGGAVLTIFADYAALTGAEKYSAISRDKNGMQVAYQKGEHPAKNKIFLVSFGDIMLGRYVRTLMDRSGLDYPFTNLNTQYMKTNDLLLGNLEGPIAENAIRTSKGIAFRFMPDVAPLLKKYDFSALSLANNHALDMGANGYDDSLKFLREQGVVPFGDTREINDNSVAQMEVDSQKIAFLGLEEVTFKIDDDKAVQKIKDLTAEGYKVIPFVHWGVEYTHTPNARQKDLAHKFVDAGAVAVIGHHPHVVQAYETYSGRPIFYSLGNAIFDQYWSADTQVGLSIAMVIEDNRIEIYFTPLDIPRSQPEIMSEEKAKKFLEEYAGYGDGSEDEKNALMEGHIVITR